MGSKRDVMMGGLGRTICVVCSSVGEIDEDGGGRGGGGKWHFGTDQCTTYRSPSGVCDSGRYEKTPMYDVVRENRYPSSGIQ